MSPSSTYLLAPGALSLASAAVGQCLAPALVEVRADLALEAGEELIEHHPAVADDADVDRARGRGDLGGVDVDAGDLGGRIEARGRGMADDVVHARAEHDDQVGVLEGRRAHRQERQRMVVGHHAASLRRRVEGDAGLLDELLHLGPGPRPDHAAAGDDHRLLGLGHRQDQRIDLLGVAQGPRVEDGPAAHRPVDLLLGDLGVEDVAGEIEIGGAGLAAHGVLEGCVHLLGDALEIVDAVGPLDAAAHDRDLVDLLEHLPAELEDRARAADGDHRAAVDQRVGETGGEIDHAGAARRHAHARALQQPAVGLAHQGGGLLVAHVDRADAFLDAGGLGQQHRSAHDEEQVIGAFLLQRLRQDLRARQLSHGLSVVVGWADPNSVANEGSPPLTPYLSVS